MTNEGLIHIALSELHTCKSYYQRLYFGLVNLSSLVSSPEVKTWATTFCYQSNLHLKRHWLNFNLEDIEGAPIRPLTLIEAKEFTNDYFKVLESSLKLDFFKEEELADKLALSLNFFFLHARRLHLFLKEKTNLEIELPRVMIMQSFETEEGCPAYRVDPSFIEGLKNERQTSLVSLSGQREKKYEDLIQKAHQWISNKEHDLARETLMRALNFKETAEAYNLIGWTYSLDSDFEKAKNFSLKAIQTDPAYGAPYNDLGSYLLAEGNVNESLKWFELAKNSRNYQNREYPFINAGRAYMGQRKYDKALEEFSMALTLAPHNEELHNTVQRIKETLNKSDLFKEAEGLPPSLF